VPKRNLRILIFNWKDLAHPAAGGAEVFTEGFARELVKRDHTVTLFASAVEGRLADEMVDGIRIVRRGGRLSVYREARRFWKEEGEGQFDVVIDEVNTRPFLTPRYIRSTPIVALIHQLAREIWRYEVPAPVGLVGRYIFEPWWLRSYRDIPVMTDSPSSAESFEAYGIKGARPLPIGAAPIDVPVVDKEESPTIIFLARLVQSKRPHHVVQAFAQVKAAVPDAQLWLVGDGPSRSKVEQLAGKGVHLFGRVSGREREELLTRAHVLVATSVREGWGLNVSEASVCGTPTIGYRAPGLVDSIPASGGHLVDPNPDSLAEALIAFFTGELKLTPVPSLVPWAEVADAVELQLREVVARAGHSAGRTEVGP
jgi:glycosyltransferase involved in cell wall biosynthesis